MNHYDNNGKKIKKEEQNELVLFQSFDEFLKNPVRKIEQSQISSKNLCLEKEIDVISQKEEMEVAQIYEINVAKT